MSLKDSKDPIEQLYGSIILQHFPNYEKFWIEFIGNPKAERAEPYRYIFSDSMSHEEKSKIEKSYEKIQISHYTIFCHLAGAYFQLKELQNAGNIKDSKEKYFRQCEHFEGGYMHLGSVFYVLETLWNTVLKLIGHKKGEERFGKLKNYLSLIGENELIKELGQLDNTMMTRRHLPVHYGRIFVTWYKDELYVPLEVKEEMVWSQGVQTKNWRKGNNQLHDDIVKTERLINNLHEFLISEYRNFINNKKIKISC